MRHEIIQAKPSKQMCGNPRKTSVFVIWCNLIRTICDRDPEPRRIQRGATKTSAAASSAGLITIYAGGMGCLPFQVPFPRVVPHPYLLRTARPFPPFGMFIVHLSAQSPDSRVRVAVLRDADVGVRRIFRRVPARLHDWPPIYRRATPPGAATRRSPSRSQADF